MTKGRRVRIRAVAGEGFVTLTTADTSCAPPAKKTYPEFKGRIIAERLVDFVNSDERFIVTFPGVYEVDWEARED